MTGNRTRLWHVREEILTPGMVIEPGRWGRTIIATGAKHPHFYREHFLELWRCSQTQVPVSRLACAFAYEDRNAAVEFARDDGLHVYEVEPVDHEDKPFRADMLWLTWMGEAGSTFQQMVSQCRAYWSGRSTRDVSSTCQPTWEWLYSRGFRVVGLSA